MSRTNIIGRHRFRITVTSPREADFIFETISDLSKRKLPEALERTLSRHDVRNQVIKIDRLNLNLGELPKQGFEQELLKRLSTALDEALQNNGAPQPSRIQPIRQSEEDLVIHYLRHGYFPWRYTSADARGVSDMLIDVLEKAPNSLRRKLKKMLGVSSIRKRLAQHFSLESLRKLKEISWGAGKTREQLILHELILAGRAGGLGAVPPRNMEAGFLVAAAGSTPRESAQASSIRWAARLINEVGDILGIPPRLLSQLLLDGAREDDILISKTTARAIRSISSSPAPVTPPAHTGREETRAVLQFLRSGRVPAPFNLSASGMEGLLKKRMEKGDEVVVKALEKIFRDLSFRQQLPRRFSGSMVTFLYRWWWRDNWEIFQKYREDVTYLLFTIDSATKTKTDLRNWVQAKLSGAGNWQRPVLPDQRAIGNLLTDWGQDCGIPVPEVMMRARAAIQEARAWESSLPTLVDTLENAAASTTFTDSLPNRVLFLLRHYLDNGFLPATDAQHGLLRLEEQILPLLHQLNPELFLLLLDRLVERKARSRLANGFSADFLETVLVGLMQLASGESSAGEVLGQSGSVGPAARDHDAAPPEDSRHLPSGPISTDQEPGPSPEKEETDQETRTSSASTGASKIARDASTPPAKVSESDLPPNSDLEGKGSSHANRDDSGTSPSAEQRQEARNAPTSPPDRALPIADKNSDSPTSPTRQTTADLTATAGRDPLQPSKDSPLAGSSEGGSTGDVPVSAPRNAPATPPPNSTWGIFYRSLPNLYPEGTRWKPTRESYLRDMKLMMLGALADPGMKQPSMGSILLRWARVLKDNYRPTAPEFSAYLHFLVGQDSLPTPLRNAVRVMQDMEEKTTAEVVSRAPETADQLPPDKSTQRDEMVEEWVTWIRGGRTSDGKRPSLSDLRTIIKLPDQAWRHFLGSIQGKQLRLDRFLQLLSDELWQALHRRLINHYLPGHRGVLEALREAIHGSKLYPNEKTTNQQYKRYTLEVLWGKGPLPFTGYSFTLKLVSLIAREKRLTTTGVAQQLQRHLDPDEGHPGLLEILARIIAQISEKEKAQIEREEARHREQFRQIEAGAREGTFFVAALQYFLDHGGIPWWAAPEISDLNMLWERAIQADMDGLRVFLRDRPNHAGALLPFLTRKNWRSFLKARFPAYVDFLEAFAAANEVLINSGGYGELSGLQKEWLSGWNFAVEAEEFSSEGFLLRAIPESAAAFGLPVDQYLDIFRAEVNASVVLGQLSFYALSRVLEDLIERGALASPLPEAPDAREKVDARREAGSSPQDGPEDLPAGVGEAPTSAAAADGEGSPPESTPSDTKGAGEEVAVQKAVGSSPQDGPEDLPSGVGEAPTSAAAADGEGSPPESTQSDTKGAREEDVVQKAAGSSPQDGPKDLPSGEGEVPTSAAPTDREGSSPKSTQSDTKGAGEEGSATLTGAGQEDQNVATDGESLLPGDTAAPLGERLEEGATGDSAPSGSGVPPKSYAETLGEELYLVGHFLRYGAPPPENISVPRERLLLLQERLLNLHPELVLPVYRSAFREVGGRNRLLHFFPESLWLQIAQRMMGRELSSVQRRWRDIRTLLAKTPLSLSEDAFRHQVWHHLLRYLGEQDQKVNVPDFTEQLLKDLAIKVSSPVETLLNTLREGLSSAPESIDGKEWDEVLGAIQKRRIEQQTENMEGDGHLIEEAIFIENAGLVILGPFLARYFSTLNMLDGKVFASEEQAIRGAQLLQYVATGLTESPEHLLVFNKILCGLHPSVPVPGSIDLTEKEEQVSSQLLQAVMQNWDKMKNSTVENFRGSFVLRPGMLMEREDQWSLAVESAGYDVLLKFLPWTISVVRLPWMEKFITVDWKT
ncbi:contractile injection system tape measure protein [Lewinella sp. W8]|uniref:contractile injection system tape measure protein n=1 Tax=Lewinella sp. W8 TaxID=2528208 RepID=UPI001067B15B|nr:contractile injection system tape measure protein [Lewinella sp. W8]MTB52951.1 hypothetical protein [Lewinella sp. W8]